VLIPKAKRASVPVVVHYDHGLTYDKCVEALKLGFTSIMYDCSTDSYAENVRKVAELTRMAHAYGATVEGELGHVGDNEGSAEANPNAKVHSNARPEDFYTDPKEAADFVRKTHVDALAIAVGTAHGAYKLPPKLDFERIETIRKTIDVPLVLHGGSGLADSDFKRAIASGISKVNIFTDINIAAVEAEFKAFTSMDKGIIDLIPAAVEAIKQSVVKKLELFDSVGKAVPQSYDVDKIVAAVIQELLKRQ
jgi:fructose-bisphosphate aldolase class II